TLDSTPTAFTTSLKPSGVLTKQTLTASLTPSSGDLGQSGCMFFGALVGGTTFYLVDSTGWAPLNPASPIAYRISPLASTQARLVDKLDLSGLIGTPIYAGYGRGMTTSACFTDMMQNQRYKQVYIIQ
uniref:hypothetical protein n=1 Tax=Chitinimonas sp. TaxID=1934313 RepID=UPI0035B1F318